MFRKIMLLTGCALTLSLFVLAGEANAQDQTKIEIADVRRSASCASAEADCVDVGWKVTTTALQRIDGFDVLFSVKVELESAPPKTRSLTVNNGSARSAKLDLPKGSVGSSTYYETSVRAFRLTTAGKVIVAAATKSGKF